MDILAALLSWLLLYKYAALFAIVYSAALLLPLPANATLLAVGAFSSQGYFNFWLSLGVAVGANTLGDLTGYAVTRHWGETVTHALRLHKFSFFNQLAEEFRTDAAITVFTTRFASSLSTISNFLAGLAKVPFGTFLFYDIAGNLIEPGAALSLGYLVGSYWNDLSGTFEIVTGIIAITIVIFVLARISQRIAKKYDRAPL
jgi:membrane protein DedA with SNARE-associated domain